MCNTGRKIYVPMDVIRELDIIRMDDDLDSKADAFRLMAKYSESGRRVRKMNERLFNLK